MVASFAIAVILALWILAVRYGYDSRDRAHSKEHELATYGVTWVDLIDSQALGLVARERRADLLGEMLRERLSDRVLAERRVSPAV